MHMSSKLLFDYMFPRPYADAVSAVAQTDAARAAGGGLSPVVGSGSRAKDAHKRGDDESLDLLLRFTSDFEPHRCQDHPIE